MRRIDADEFRSTTQVVAEEFSPEWLTTKVQEARDGRSLDHPVPLAWAEAVELLRAYDQTGLLSKTGRTISLASFGSNLSMVRTLPNYSQAIRSRLTNAVEFPKVDYEIFVASLWARAGYSAEFIPTRPYAKTPEMRINIENAELFIECKSRDTYVESKSADDGDFWRELQFALVDLREDEEIGAGLELFIFIPGKPDLSMLPKIVTEVRLKLRTGYRGSWEGRQGGYLARELELPANGGQGLKLFVPARQDSPFTATSAFVAATVGIDNQGQLYPKDPMRIILFAIDSYKLSAVANSFDDARHQIPQDALGIIYINLDVANLDEAQSAIYIDLAAHSLATRFAPSKNTRIRAVVITTEPQIIHSKRGNREMVFLSRMQRIIRNPYHALPAGLAIPGE